MAVVYKKHIFLTIPHPCVGKVKTVPTLLLHCIPGNSTGKQKWGNDYSDPLVSAGDWFQDPVRIPKSMFVQVLYIKWHSSIFHC